MKHRRRPHRRLLGRFAAATAVVAATAISEAAAATCSVTGEPAPGVVTLMASKTNPATDAWVVTPACKYDTVSLSPSEETVGPLYVDSMGIERVASVPTDTTSIEATRNSLSRGADFSAARQALSLILSSIPTDPTSLVLPPYLRKLSILSDSDSFSTSLDGVKLPDSLGRLYLSQVKIKSLKNVRLPDKMTELHLEGAPSLSDINFQFPAALIIFSLTDAKVGSFEQKTLPSTLENFGCVKCGLTSIRGVRWPASLKTLNLDGNPITSFEVRQSDVAILKKLKSFSATTSQTACSGSGTLETVGSTKLCVIPDTEFDAGSSPTSTDPKASGTSKPGVNSTGGSSGGSHISGGSASSSSRTGGSIDADSAHSATSESELGGSKSSTANETAIGPDGKSQNSPSEPSLSTRSPRDGPEAASTEMSSTGSSSNLLTIVLSSVISLAVVAVAYRIYVIAKRRRKKNVALTATTDTPTDDFQLGDTPRDTTILKVQQHPTSESTEMDTQALDFRNDKELMRSRIEQVQIGDLIARGGYGVVYRGSFEGRAVAIKQMHPDAWRNDSMIAAFVDEIHMCARLDHPKIVEFIGVTWTRVRDLSVVTEFMAGGDLHSVLHKYTESSGREWVTSWGANALKSKTLIAMDVAEAVVYLHSFSSPIIHRDLKAKNVLLDPEGNAKLSDFGISRELSIDETMTSEIGTAAWIAPEVLRGDRYSEKADIYSLGVLLVELDRCRHPYANERMLLMASSHRGDAVGRNSTSHVAHKNTQIAVLVSTGKLRPSPSQECPDDVAELVGRCLSYEASERPTAMEVFYELRQIRKAQEP